MTSRFFHCFLVSLALAGMGLLAQGGMTSPYAERGKADFDAVMPLLNPYGTWSKIDGLWAYTPLDHQAPYTNGRWIYTEYGWYWKGTLPHSWATEHYGYWKRSADKIWSWYPGPVWLAETVEIRATPTHIGWRSAAVDADGNFMEDPVDRYTKEDEWTFVTLAQFANPITTAIAAKPDAVRELLDISTDSHHAYFTYREIDRPGPHAADFLTLSKDGGMFAPQTLQDELAAQPAPPPPIIPGYTPAVPGTNSPAAKMTGTNAPTLIGTDTDPELDKRKVKYWITMSLPTYWAKRPSDAKPEEIYLYHPDFYQDGDGIERRIALWFNPKTRTTLKDLVNDETNAKPGTPAPAASAFPSSPAVPATAASASPSHDPFRSPFDESFHAHSSSTSSKSPAASDTNASDTVIPSPLKNGAPTPAN
jgi:hypothetical protein